MDENKGMDELFKMHGEDIKDLYILVAGKAREKYMSKYEWSIYHVTKARVERKGYGYLYELAMQLEYDELKSQVKQFKVACEVDNIKLKD